MLGVKLLSTHQQSPDNTNISSLFPSEYGITAILKSVILKKLLFVNSFIVSSPYSIADAANRPVGYQALGSIRLLLRAVSMETQHRDVFVEP